MSGIIFSLLMVGFSKRSTQSMFFRVESWAARSALECFPSSYFFYLPLDIYRIYAEFYLYLFVEQAAHENGLMKAAVLVRLNSCGLPGQVQMTA